MPKLWIITPEGDQTPFELGPQPIRVGRSEECDFVLRNDAEVSRFHARLWCDDAGQVMVADLGSKNGTRVDEHNLFRDQTHAAQRLIRIGEHKISLVNADEEVIVDGPEPPVDTQFFPSTRSLDLNQHRLQLLIQLTQRIGGTFERKQLLEQALDACCDALKFERGLIVLKTQRGDTELPVTRNVDRDETGTFKVSRTLLNRALIKGERAIVNNPATDLEGKLTESMVRFPICSALCVPILNRDDILGVIYGDRVTQASTYSTEDVDFLAAIAQQVGVGLANLNLIRTEIDALQVRAELDKARVIQQQMLPAGRLERDRTTIEGHNEPSAQVSGDYFDYFDIDDDKAGFIIADVVGHGLPAALVMANLQSAVRVALAGSTSLPGLATRVNQLLCENTNTAVFVTGVLGIVHTRTGVIEYVSAGHPGPILIDRSGARSHEELGGFPLGIDPDETYEVFDLKPTPGPNAALFFTDGLIEALSDGGDLLGLDPVIEAVNGLAEVAPDVLIRTARNVVKGHIGRTHTADDLTLLVINYRHD